MRVKFIKSPTALFNLAYFPGDVVEFKDDDKCRAMIKAGIAQEVENIKPAKKRKDN